MDMELTKLWGQLVASTASAAVSIITAAQKIKQIRDYNKQG